jgi:hypothetical protein
MEDIIIVGTPVESRAAIEAKKYLDHILRLSFIPSADPLSPFIILSQRVTVPSSVHVVRITEKKKGVKTVKTKTIFSPAHDVLDIRIGFNGVLYSGQMSYKSHNVARPKSTKSTKDVSWSPHEFIDTLQAAIQ